MKPPRAGAAGWLALFFGAAAMLAVAVGGRFPAEPIPPEPARLELNTATARELAGIRGLGASRAAALVRARTRRGGFRRWQEIEDIKGLGPALRARLRQELTLGGQTTREK